MARALPKLPGYEPLVTLASGGMATLYIGRKTGAAGFERLVAIKRIHAHLVENSDFRDMFRDEARVCSVIRHPNVVPMLDVVDAEDELLLVLEYVESMSLGELIRRAHDEERPIPPAIVSRILSDALAGLDAAHEAKDLRGERLDVIHRDVSPQNVIVGIDGTSRLIDFGIAKAAARMSVTNSGVLKGKLRYMSPEQVRRQPLDQRSDLFAAGAVLFEGFTGERLLPGEDEGDIALALLLGDYATPTSVRADLPPAIDDIVAKALARDPNDRYQRASEMQEALERAVPPASPREVGRFVEELGGDDLATRRKGLQEALDAARVPEQPPSLALPSTLTEFTPARRSRRTMTVALAVVVVAAAVGIALTVQASRAPEPIAKPEASASASAEPLATSASASATSSATADSPSASARAIASETAPSGVKPPTAPARKPTRPPSDLHRKNPYGAQ